MSQAPSQPIDAQAFAEREAKLLRRVERERRARKEAEGLLEDKSLDLFIANKELLALNEKLENKVIERTKALEEALEKAQAAAVAKTEFLAVMSHEIRTPMNAVIGLSDLIARTPLNPEQQQFIKTLRNSGQTLLSLINDILDFSKIDAGKLELTLTPTRLDEIINETQDILAIKARTKNIQLRVSIEPRLNRLLLLDGVHLKQVLFNLLGNAIKFTEQGSVELRVTQPSQKRLKFEVIDTGIGICEADQAHLFEAFTQVDSSQSRQYQGTGLGLAISANLVALMQGELKVDSTPEKGSRFYFDIPMVELVDQTHPVLPKPAPEPTPEPTNKPAANLDADLKILLVEDNPVNQMLAVKFLEKLGLRPSKANNGLEAIELIQTETFDIILMDLQMPQMDGISATQFIRKLGTQISQPRIVALTANAFTEDRDACFAAGMDAFLSKPITLDKLKAQLLIEQSHLKPPLQS